MLRKTNDLSVKNSSINFQTNIQITKANLGKPIINEILDLELVCDLKFGM